MSACSPRTPTVDTSCPSTKASSRDLHSRKAEFSDSNLCNRAEQKARWQTCRHDWINYTNWAKCVDDKFKQRYSDGALCATCCGVAVWAWLPTMSTIHCRVWLPTYRAWEFVRQFSALRLPTTWLGANKCYIGQIFDWFHRRLAISSGSVSAVSKKSSSKSPKVVNSGMISSAAPQSSGALWQSHCKLSSDFQGSQWLCQSICQSITESIMKSITKSITKSINRSLSIINCL